MKISVELQSCLKSKSGIGVYTYELTRRLHQYKDITLTGDIFNFLNRNNLALDMNGLNFTQSICTLLPYRIYCSVWNYLPISYNNLFKEEADITHFFNFIVPPRVKGKVVNCIHDLTFELYPETMDKRNLKRITKDIKYSIERSDKIVTISESTKRDLINRLNVDPTKIEIIYPGVDYPIFNATYEASKIIKVKKRYSLPEQYILYMGTLEPRKNIESIIQAFSLLKEQVDIDFSEVKLVIAGKKGWLFESIDEEVQKFGIEDQVIFTDYIDEEDKPIIYQQAALFVFPSLYEGFGIPVLEAMAASVPVITSNVSSLPEVGGEAAILVEPKDTKAIAESMQKVLIDTEYAQELVLKGHHQAQKFSWDESAEKLYKLYQSMM